MHIYIPTRGRMYKQITWSELPSTLRDITTFVCPENESAHFMSLARGTTAKVLIPDELGIAAARHEILKDAKRKRHHHILMLDDDLRFFHRRDAAKITRFGPAPSITNINVTANKSALFPALERNKAPDNVRMVLAIDKLLNVYIHAAISAREGNNRLDGYGYPVVENKRMLRALAYNVPLVLKYGKFPLLPVMEDFDLALCLLTQRFPSAVQIHYAQDQTSTQMAGGCSIYRTHELQTQAVHGLHAKYPDFVKVVKKKNKTKARGGFEERTEAVIYWKKAFEHGQSH